MTHIEYRPIQIDDIDPVVKAHLDELGDEFLVKFGESFLRIYYRVWIKSPYSFNIVAVSNGDDRANSDNMTRGVDFASSSIAGAMLSNLDPSNHYKYILKHHIFVLGAAATAVAIKKPKFLVELIRTRGIYYVKGLAKAILKLSKSRLKGTSKNRNDCSLKSDRVLSQDSPGTTSNDTAELTHIFVASDGRLSGIGKELIKMLSIKCIEIGISKIELVTPTDSPAVNFYERLNFSNLGTINAKTGETFVKFRLDLQLQ
jgi:ribosomal protein S18 acetylase RimI-like enzyme